MQGKKNETLTSGKPDQEITHMLKGERELDGIKKLWKIRDCYWIPVLFVPFLYLVLLTLTSQQNGPGRLRRRQWKWLQVMVIRHHCKVPERFSKKLVLHWLRNNTRGVATMTA